nr:hypothetical protein [Spirochaeta sp.]
MDFEESFWEKITLLVAEAFRLSPGELARLRETSTARLIAAIPVLAGCHDADRIACQHVSTYLIARSASSIFDHRREDDSDVLARLERISHFPDGDRKVIDRGMSLLALIMLSNYERSRETDLQESVYNPIVSGSWDVEALRSRLIKRVRAIASPAMDAIIDLEQAVRGSWN